jgi:hypothetical protein
MRLRLVGLAAATMLLASGAFAHVIDPAVNKDAYKLRADIAKQVSKYTFCLVKAATACEKKGLNSGVECSLATGTISFPDATGKVQPKFQAAIAKCDAKLDLDKKGSDYVGVGCPGDCGAADGIQQCADIPAFEATVEAVTSTSAKGQLGALAGAIDFFCGMALGGANTDEARIDCATDNAKALSKYSQGLFKCQGKCQLDVKDKIGNGGLANGSECLSGLSTEAAFNTCDAAALSKAGALNPTVQANVLPLVRGAVNDATQGLFDRFDPTGNADDSPCGACGDGIRAGAEECDLSDDALCGGPCNSDCTCP